MTTAPAPTSAPDSDPSSSLEKLARTSPPVALPAIDKTLEQDAEWFLVKQDGRWRELRLHDYEVIFTVPGLYEKIVYDICECVSPSVIREELMAALGDAGVDPAHLTVLDLGAGNGVVAEELQSAGIGTARNAGFIGADLIQEAADAAERDRPGLYSAFVVGDITNLPEDEEAKLERTSPDVLTCVAALGFGDIPPEAFAKAFEQIPVGGWVAFCIKDDFLDSSDSTGFSSLIREMAEGGVVEIARQKRYVHRRAFSGEQLEYVAYIARKKGEIRD